MARLGNGTHYFAVRCLGEVESVGKMIRSPGRDEFLHFTNGGYKPNSRLAGIILGMESGEYADPISEGQAKAYEEALMGSNFNPIPIQH